MTDNDHLTALINRIRSGDPEAIKELIASYKDEAKAAIRHILNAGNKLRRSLDSSEILQSVLIRLYGHAAEPQSQVENGAAYLGTALRNRSRDHVRRQRTQKRDASRVCHGDEALGEIADPSPSPAAALMQQDLLEAVWNALSPSERVVAERRMAGDRWEEIASGIGGKADTTRKRFGRRLEMLGQSLLGE